jgi:hypothetical protein
MRQRVSELNVYHVIDKTKRTLRDIRKPNVRYVTYKNHMHVPQTSEGHRQVGS